jgi:hypothetical protein
VGGLVEADVGEREGKKLFVYLKSVEKSSKGGSIEQNIQTMDDEIANKKTKERPQNPNKRAHKPAFRLRGNPKMTKKYCSVFGKKKKT